MTYVISGPCLDVLDKIGKVGNDPGWIRDLPLGRAQ
jgi:hypothetical protein